MKFIEREFVPLVLGGDINTYSVARAFYEKYQVKTYVIGKYPAGPSRNSRIAQYTDNIKIDTDDGFLKIVNQFAKDHKDKKVIVMGCGDNYVALISKHKNELEKNVIAPYIDFDLMDSLQQKEKFYKLCDKHGIDYPATLVYKKEMGDDFSCEFQYPVILKPSNGVEYWEHPFATQEKVYEIQNREELIKVIHDVYHAGYTDSLIIQDKIPGNDEYMYVLTSFSNQKGEVKMMCLGHVMLEEHTPHGKGNHAVIITEPNKELMEKAKVILEDLNYKGFSNFDIKYDTRDKKYKFFELNTRQGRSNFYVTGSGFNVASYIVDEYVYGKDKPFEMAMDEHLWMVVPKAVAYKYVKNQDYVRKMKQLVKENKMVNPVFFKGDLAPKRFFTLFKTHVSHFVKYKKYYQ